MKVNIHEEKVIHDGFLRLERAELQFERFDGTMSPRVERMQMVRGEAAAILLYHTEKEAVLLVEQFRYSAWKKGNGWMTEIVAGGIDLEEDAATAAIREVQEETGYQISSPRFLSSFFPTPGCCTEKLHLFYAEISEKDRVNQGGGVQDESEDLKIIFLPRAEIENGNTIFQFEDAKTQIALNWLRAEWLQEKVKANK